ncbi:unnamed protein product [Prorocentrum cordatum]|uniref:Pre-mRNA-splicing factor SLU7 n=1 Tax=Prorocentrum cordatum TaxID=2364126 RepID=A0ABN9WEW0_9DINO|nr:unnamed protein product [Polarella glacialis]
MSKRFVPVSDPEKPRTEQDEEGLRKHRQFDTPHAKLKDDLNKPRAPREDNNHPGKPTGKLAKDKDQLWRKKEEIHAKNNLFDKQKTWGRETFDYSNPEEARADGKGDRKKKPGEVHWGVKGSFGGRGEDTGVLILQRGEVDQRMELNDKGLWVKKKKEAGADDGADKPKVDEAAQRDLLRAAPSREDPRLEAAKQKGRGGPDAAAKALQALQARRAVEKKVQDKGFLLASSSSFLLPPPPPPSPPSPSPPPPLLSLTNGQLVQNTRRCSSVLLLLLSVAVLLLPPHA